MKEKFKPQKKGHSSRDLSLSDGRIEEDREEGLTLSATKVKIVLTCEQQYYYEYVERRDKSEERLESLKKGESIHSRVFNPIREGGWKLASEKAKEDKLLSSVYKFLPKDDQVSVEQKITFRENGFRKVAIPDILYRRSLYDLKTTFLPSSMNSPRLDDIIQVHFYYEVIQKVDPRPNLDMYIIKVLLPKEQEKSVLEKDDGHIGKHTNGYTNGHTNGHVYSISLFKINLVDPYFSKIRKGERRILEIHGGSPPRPNPGRACVWCGFNHICPFSAYKPGGSEREARS